MAEKTDAQLIAEEEERRRKFATKQTTPAPTPQPSPPPQEKSFLEGLKEDILYAIKGK